jgi:drug/metabolite transporter (DMT)-like permease
MNESRPDLTTGFLFAAAVMIGGANFVAVRFSNRELDPFWGAGLRFALAGLLFAGFCVVRRLAWPKGRQLGLIVVYGLLSFAVSYALMYWALVQVSAGFGAVVLAAVPLVTALLAAAQRLERLDPRSLAGALVALAGIMWIALDAEGLVLPVAAVGAMILATLTVSQGVIVGKRVSVDHPAIVNAVGMAAGVPVLLTLSLVVGEQWGLPQAPEVAWSLAYLVVVGSVGLFVAFLTVIRRWTASATAYSFVLFPVVAMLLEAWLQDVPLTVRRLSGALVVMAGVWFGAFSRPRHVEEAPAEETPCVTPGC